jgi:ABC-2 type transport system permease protein
MIDATQGIKVAYEAQSMAEAERLMLHGEALAIIYIDEDFERNILSGIPAKVEGYTLGTNISADGITESNIQQTVMTLSSGIALNRLQAIGMKYDEAMVDIMPINILTNIVANPYLNYGYYLAPIFMFMGIVILTVVSTVYALGRELRYATASEWLEASKGSLLAAVKGKMLPITIIMTIMMQLILLILTVIMGMECMGSYIYITLGGILFIVAYQSVAIFIISITSNLRLGLSLGGGYAVMAFTFSGITFPVTAMFEAIQPFSKLFPLTYFSEIFIDQMMLGTPISYDITNTAMLILFILLIVAIWHRLNRVVRNEKYWSKS